MCLAMWIRQTQGLVCRGGSLIDRRQGPEIDQARLADPMVLGR